MCIYSDLFSALSQSFKVHHNIGYDAAFYNVTFDDNESCYEHSNEKTITVDYLKEFSENTGEHATVSISSKDNSLVIDGIGPILKIDENSINNVFEIMNLIIFVLSTTKESFDNENDLIDDDFEK